MLKKKIEEMKVLQSSKSPAANSFSRLFTNGNNSGPTFKSYSPKKIPTLEIPEVRTADIEFGSDEDDGLSDTPTRAVSVKLESRGTYILDE